LSSLTVPTRQSSKIGTKGKREKKKEEKVEGGTLQERTSLEKGEQEITGPTSIEGQQQYVGVSTSTASQEKGGPITSLKKFFLLKSVKGSALNGQQEISSTSCTEEYYSSISYAPVPSIQVEHSQLSGEGEEVGERQLPKRSLSEGKRIRHHRHHHRHHHHRRLQLEKKKF